MPPDPAEGPVKGIRDHEHRPWKTAHWKQDAAVYVRELCPETWPCWRYRYGGEDPFRAWHRPHRRQPFILL